MDMKKFGLKAACILAVVSAMGCGGPSSQLSGTSWTSSTNLPAGMSNGVTTSTFVMHFAAATATTTSTATGAFTGTLTEVYGTTGSRAGCTDVTTLAGGSYTDTYSSANDLTGSVDITGSTVSIVSTGCMNTANNGTVTVEPLNDLPNNGGSDVYTVSGTMMTFSASDSDVPYDGAWTFTKM